MFKRILIAISLGLFITGTIFSQPIVKATLDASEYKVGDMIKVKVALENNPGFHSIYFDLEYDGSILSFEEMRKGSVAFNAGDTGELLYADNGMLEGFTQAKTVVSFSMKGPGLEIKANGGLVELSYRITGSNTNPHSFAFNTDTVNKKALDGKKAEIPGIVWLNAPVFSIKVPAGGEFILIKRPYDNEVFYQDTAKVSLICTEGNYLVRFSNSRLPDYYSDFIPVTNGRLLNYDVPLGSNMNNLCAELFLPNHNFLKKHSVKIYRSPENEFVNIKEPQDHSLLNTDMADVKILSPLDYVEVNGLTAKYNGEIDGTSKVYRARVWLKNGFNTITAVALKNAPQNILFERNTSTWIGATWLTDASASWTPNEFAGKFLEVNGGFATITDNTSDTLNFSQPSSDLIALIGSGIGGLGYKIRSTRENETVSSVKFKDSIQVYYQKDTSIFNFIAPLANQGYKPSAYSFLAIKGEIDSMYKTSDDPATGGPVENKVTLRVTFKPSNPLKSDIPLVTDRLAKIEESDFGYGDATSKYVFRNDFDIPLAGLSDGEIEIVAFKNLNGNIYDDKITRIVYIDNQRLWIDLVQPNVFTCDLLDTVARIRNFNETLPINNPDNSIIVSNEGEIRLATQDPVAEEQTVTNLVDVTEAPDGTLYGVSNSSTSLMSICKKELGKADWEVILTRPGMYGYSIAYTEIGPVVGVSNIPANGNSGLYIVSGSKLFNFEFTGESIPHAQFVECYGSIVFIYGSLFEYIYSFDIRNIEENNGKYRVSNLAKTGFQNTTNLRQFILSKSTGTAVLLSDDETNNVRFYRKTASGYEPVIIPDSSGALTIHGASIAYGNYEGSDYNAYVITREGSTVEVVMENKSTSTFFRRNLDLARNPETSPNGVASQQFTSLLGVGYNGDSFYFVFENDNAGTCSYFMEKGIVLFDRFMPDPYWQTANYACSVNIDLPQSELFLAASGAAYLGIGQNMSVQDGVAHSYCLYKKYAQNGSCNFNYVNDDIDGLTGCEFEVGPRWIAESGKIDFGFSIRQKTGVMTAENDPAVVSLATGDLFALLATVDSGAFSNPDFSINHFYNSATGRERVHFEFTSLWEEKYLRFNIGLHASGLDSPSVCDITVCKKVRAKITNAPGEKIVLPIQGYVYDRTATEISIQNNRVQIGRNGYFSYNYTVENALKLIPVNLSCYNVIGERADLSFNVEIVESKNDIWDAYYSFDGTSLPLVQPGGSTSFTINTTKRNLVLSGKYYGLAGAIVGYKLYAKDAAPGDLPLKQGMITVQKVQDVQVFTGIDLGTGYEAGTFVSDIIDLFPNEQRLVLYIENPGSVRYEYKSESGLYPVFNYSMPASEQEIVFNADADENAVVDSIQITKKLLADALPTSTALYSFVSEGNVTGEIRSIERFDEILIRSYTQGLVFENGQSQIVVKVGEGNKFSVPYKATMGDFVYKDFDVAAIPTIPVYNYLKKGLRISIKKNYADADYIPDFTGTHPESWNEQQKRDLADIPIRFTFKKIGDIPSPNMMKATLTVNFDTDHEIIGYVNVLDNEYLCLRDENGNMKNLTGINRGKNRIQWRFAFEEKLDATHVNSYLISSSYSGNEGMSDDIFEVTDDVVTAPTLISFAPALSDVYYNNKQEAGAIPVPALSFTKDSSTGLSFALNGAKVWEDTNNATNLVSYRLPASSIREGRNELIAEITDKYGDEETRTYSFLYDSNPPVVKIASVNMNPAYTALVQVVADVKEANYSRAYLHYGSDIINAEPEVMMRGKDSYLLVWQNLESYGIDPGTKPVAIEVRDLAAKSSTDSVSGFLVMERPDEVAVREKQIELPLYDGSPLPANETNYEARPFPGHTKFAPAKLLEKVSVKEELEGNGNVLIRNFTSQKVLASDGFDNNFGYSVAISGDFAIVGSPYDDDKGTDSGSAYMYKRDFVTGVWEEQTPKLVASDGVGYDSFGYSVAISGDFAIVGSIFDDDKGLDSGSAYMFKRNPMTEAWEQQTPKLLASDGVGDDRFGYSVAISGDFAIVGSILDDDKGTDSGSAYIFKRNPVTGAWEEQTPKLVASDGVGNDRFGRAVAISGDFAIVGSPYEDDKGTDSGSAYMFKRNPVTGLWEQQTPKLVASDGVGNDNFGYSVAISGDFAIVGSLLDDDKGTNSGSSYMFKRNPVTGAWEQQTPKLVASDGVGNDYFGRAVAISGDFAIVSSPYDDDKGTDSGSSYMFKRNPVTGVWEQQTPKLVASDGTQPDQFGASVDISEDFIIASSSYRVYAYIYSKNSDTLSTDTTIDVHNKKYLVFQVAIDPFDNNITNKGQLKDIIKFSVIGRKQIPLNPPETQFVNVPSTPVMLDLADDKENVIQGLNYLYYVVDIDELKVKYTEACNTQILPQFQPTDIIFDRGSLSVSYVGLEKPEKFGPYNIYVTGEPEIIDPPKAATLIDDIIVFDTAYETGGSVQPGYIIPPADFNHPIAERSVTITDSPAEMSLAFWLRIEDEDAMDSQYSNKYKRLFTLRDSDGDELYHLGYRGATLDFYDETTGTAYSRFADSPIGPSSGSPIGPLSLGLNAWSFITLRLDPDAGTANPDKSKILLDVYDAATQSTASRTILIDKDYFTELLSQNASYYFGPKTDDFNTGFYSIAGPFYIDRLLTNAEITRMSNFFDRNAGGERTYKFPDATSGFSPDHFDLHKIGGSNYFNQNNNSDYTEEATAGSFKASSSHPNLLKVADHPSGGHYVILRDANTCIRYDVTVSGSDSSFTLTPDAGRKGRYYFGDKSSNYGLGKDRWYSITGEVLSDVLEPAPCLVMTVNGSEQRMKLSRGRFHFIYDNASQATPSEIKIYIETADAVTLGTDMILNKGNYVLPTALGLESTAASTTFTFDVSGNISFWYKTLAANGKGLVDYPVVLFDSEYVKIGARPRTGMEGVCFYADIKSSSTGTIWKSLDTNISLDYQWHHLQLAYDVEHKVVYFYVDGRIAAKNEGEALTVFGSLQGVMPVSDNVFIGCNLDKTVFAEGYVDDLYISKYYGTMSYTDNTPVALSYNSDQKKIELDYLSTNETDVAGLTYTLYTAEGSIIGSGAMFDIDTSFLPAGRYIVSASMKIKGHAYSKMLTFNVADKPRFNLTDRSPIVFLGEKKDIFFTFEYDHSYRYNTESLKYVGIAVKLKNNSTSFGDPVFLVQDFISQDGSKWLIGRYGEGGVFAGWTALEKGNDGRLTVTFPDVIAEANIECRYEYFYFTGTFPNLADFNDPLKAQFADGLPKDKTIPLATLTEPEIKYNVYENENNVNENYEYMISVGLEGDQGYSSAIFSDIFVEYEAVNTTNTAVKMIGTARFSKTEGDQTLKARIYYDVMLGDKYGKYTCTLRLKYNNITYATRIKPLVWKQRIALKTELSRLLEIEEFSLTALDKERDKAGFYLQYGLKDIGNIGYMLTVRQDAKTVTSVTGELSNMLTFAFWNEIAIPKKKSIARITLSASGVSPVTREIELSNFQDAPEITLTNSVDSAITYNDVFFSWKGYFKGEYLDNIQYSYNFNGAGWSTPNSEWRNVRYYNLADGNYSFQVKAIYNGAESSPTGVDFFVDVNRPVFHPEHISIEKLYNKDILYAVKVTGKEGAITDASLRTISISTGQSLSKGSNGSFTTAAIPLTTDGTNTFYLTATDKVGNYTDYSINVDNPITEIMFPALGRTVKYSPLTIVGKIASDISAKLDIYVKDPYCGTGSTGDYSGWKKATINPDRTFFVENVFVNPGTKEKPIVTKLLLASVFETGEVFTREMPVIANEILLPIELSVSTHAAESEGSDTLVTIDCRANVDFISSWSIDFDGDGVYDSIKLTNNPFDISSKQDSWDHTYSSIGLVKPRVRAITVDGNFFSVSDTLIIHEKIKEASNKTVANPLSVSSLRMPDNSYRLFVLSGAAGSYAIDVFQIGRNDTYISNKLYSIDLSSLGITEPVIARALDTDHIVIGSNVVGSGMLYEIATNDYGNYSITTQAALTGSINEIAFDDYALYVSFENRNYITKVPVVSKAFDISRMTDIVPGMYNTVPIGDNSGIAKDNSGMLVADYYNQRIVRLTNSLSMQEQYGNIGTGEKEFLTPTIIKVIGNRVFVYDETRHDIQVFDLQFTPVCTLDYSTEAGSQNYLEAEFFNNIRDIDIVTRTEGDMLYYYALILSESKSKLALLRLPQWEELRARVRNNKITYIREGEVFTAKPEGSDLRRILSSDSLPRIEGALDFPALSPDGKVLVFTSRLDLYIGSYEKLENTGNGLLYDRLYAYDIEAKTLKKLVMGEIQGYEIERPVFNSNGDKLILGAKGSGGTWQLYTCDLITGLVERVFSSDENARFPYYSPDDRFIAFTTDYDGDEDITIIDTQNLNMRVSVTNNNARDSLPVWAGTYPFEISNEELKIESKISYVSERNYKKGLYCVYLARKSDSDIRIVTAAGQDIGDNPDSAAIRITSSDFEGDYPCFTGDGTALVFEHYNGEDQFLEKYDFTEVVPENRLTPMTAFGEASRPSGMKNMITSFTAVNANGDEIELSWNRYTDNDIFYTVQFKPNNETAQFTEKKVFSQAGTFLKGLDMGQEYIVRVCIVENGETVASSQWKKVKIPVVVAKPSFEIDPENPYLVHLEAWKPEAAQNWRFAWIIDNNEHQVQESTEFAYEYATSGKKTIQLKAYVGEYTDVSISNSFTVDIKSDIEPFIEPVLAEDSSFVELSCLKSKGSKINFATAVWTITGPGGPMIQLTGPVVIAQLDGFSRKIVVNLTLQRITVNGQSATDTIVKTKTIDLDLKDLVPVITQTADKENKRLLRFSGQDSIGNIDWYNAQWVVFADNAALFQASRVSTFDYLFPERNGETVYTVSLTIPRKNDGTTQTVSQFVYVEPTAIEPKIDYEILDLKQGTNVVGQKIFFDCTKSKGSDIDFSQARWSLPVAGTYGEQAVQVGPTATYNLAGIPEDTVVEVALTLLRRGGTDAVTKMMLVSVSKKELAESLLVVSPTIEKSSVGTVLILDVLKSTGPNIDWERTDWLIDGQYSRKGPSVRYDIPASSTAEVVTYTCTLFRFGNPVPETETDQVRIDESSIVPVINTVPVPSQANNVFKLDVLRSRGINIDWERTRWYIHDGNQDVVIKQGAVITHAFSISSESMGYSVFVEMFFKGDTMPFISNKTIQVEEDMFVPVIRPYVSENDANVIMFSAEASIGHNIDWQQAKWTFLDTAETAYGQVVAHRFPLESSKKSYTVALTLTRKLSNGQVETKTTQKKIDVAEDSVIPVVKAKLYDNNYLVLSAEESRGKGLLLERSVWTFPGKGDSTSYSEQYKMGKLDTSAISLGGGAKAEAGVEFGASFGIGDIRDIWYAKASVEGHALYDWTSVDYTGSTAKDISNSSSSSNSQTGVLCRRYVENASGTIMVTLLVFRGTKDGGVEGKSITVNVDLTQAKSGVSYE